jgi:acyl-CoA synthetase (NDP forming)
MNQQLNINLRLQAMEKIFTPRSVAFIGASNNTTKWGGIVFSNILKGGFKGTVYPVNPKESTIQGHEAYRSVLDIPHDIDLAILVVPASAIPDTVSECVQKGINAGIVITAGFAELGEEGRELQVEMLRRARNGGMILVGPNGMGIASPSASFFSWLPTFKPDRGVIGIVSQSGGVLTDLTEGLAEYGFGCSKVVSAGNCADLSLADYLDYFRNDTETEVILLYVEGLQKGREFLQAAKRAALKKPLVLVKSGRTDAGVRAALSHTASLSGADELFAAVCKQSGVNRVNTLDEAVVLAASFVKIPLPKGRRLGILTGGGGHGVLMADAASSKGIELVELSENTIRKLKPILPPWWKPNNPVDMVAGMGYGGPLHLLPILLKSGQFDGIIYNGIGWAYTTMDPVNAPFDVNSVKQGSVKDRLDETKRLSDAVLKLIETSDVPLLVVSKATHLAIRRHYEAILTFLNQNIMLFSTENVIDAFAAMADRYEFLKKQNT